MHRFLTAFLCLSTLAMTQNVVAGTRSPLATLETQVIAAGGYPTGLEGEAVSRGTVGGEVPSPGSMMLLVTGLAGLATVGSRGRVAKPATRP